MRKIEKILHIINFVLLCGGITLGSILLEINDFIQLALLGATMAIICSFISILIDLQFGE